MVVDNMQNSNQYTKVHSTAWRYTNPTIKAGYEDGEK